MAENSGLMEVLRSFLRPHEKVLVCGNAELEGDAADATAALGGEIVLWSGKQTWQDLLRLAFAQRATVLIGRPRIILALAKIARITGTPLPVRHVVLLGPGRDPWLLKGIQDSLDAKIHYCDTPGLSESEDSLLQQLDEMLLSWSSVLDYRAKRTEQGLALEIVVFSGR